MDTLQQEVLKEKARRELEKRYQPERESLYEFLLSYRSLEKKQEIDENWHIKEICSCLEDVYYGKTKRLIINIPPRSLKTEIVSKAFPVWCLGQDTRKKFMQISYSAELSQKNSGGARDMYTSQTYRRMFPRVSDLKEDQSTKQHWENQDGGQYYAAGSTGTITGIGADIIIIDDPIKPDEADSELVRTKVNNNYHDTIKSRLNDKSLGAIVIIMQRLHDNDLCGHLLELTEQGLGEDWKVLKVSAIAEEKDMFRAKGESFFPKRFPLDILDQIKRSNAATFSCQYQQDPINKATQEFHEEWFRYFDEIPTGGRIFTTCDPAFTKKAYSDSSCVMTGKFIGEKMYILEYTVGKFDPGELIEKMIYHIKKREPEKIGIESYAAQVTLNFSLRAELERRNIWANVEELTQKHDKHAKIRRLIPLYRNGLIYHRAEMYELETQLKKFPRGQHDDICLAGDTMIATTTGNKKIKHMKTGDRVITPLGSSRVVSTGCTGYKTVIDRYGMRITKNHKVFDGEKFKEIVLFSTDQATNKFTLNNMIRWTILRKLYLSEQGMPYYQREDITSLHQALMKEGKTLNDFMSLSMRNIIRRMYQNDTVCITRMVIPLIMTSTTWSVWKLRNMLNFIGRKGLRIMSIWSDKESTWKKSDQGQKNDIVVKREDFGIANMLNLVYQLLELKNGGKPIGKERHVKSAEKDMKVGTPLEYTVVKDATTEYKEEKEKTKGKEYVYNLSVEYGCYYANGNLVSNCDAEQMLYDLYKLQPNSEAAKRVKIEYDNLGRPQIVGYV